MIIEREASVHEMGGRRWDENRDGGVVVFLPLHRATEGQDGKLTGRGAHRGVLNFEEGSRARHDGRGLMESTEGQEVAFVGIEDGGDETKGGGRARWGCC